MIKSFYQPACLRIFIAFSHPCVHYYQNVYKIVIVQYFKMISKKRRIIKHWRFRKQSLIVQMSDSDLEQSQLSVHRTYLQGVDPDPLTLDPDPPAPDPDPPAPDPDPPAPDPPTPPPQPQTWNLAQTASAGSSASNVSINGTKVSFSFPSYSQVIYPGQSVRLSTGWTVQTMPTDTMMHIHPHPQLLNYNVISYPQIYHGQDIGHQIVQVILNNSKLPVQFMYKSDSDQSVLKFYSLDDTLQLVDQQDLQFDIGNFFTGLLGVASHIIPALL